MATNKTSLQSPLTQAQLEYLTHQTERAAAKAARGESRKVLKRYVQGAVVAFLILLTGLGWSLYAQGKDSSEGRTAIVQSGRAISVDGCNRDFRTIGKVRDVFMRSALFLRAQYDRGDITLAAYERGVAYYSQQLATFPLPDCRAALTIVTDDPNATVRVPVPLHPTAPPTLHGNR
jgi:hypothetical protein